MEIRCVKCHRFIIELEYKQESNQDFCIVKICPKCKTLNKFHFTNKTSEGFLMETAAQRGPK